MLHKLRFLLYGALIFSVLGAMLAWETDRNRVRRWLYPVKGQLVSLSTQCDAQAPVWLKEAAKTLATRFDSPANQLVYWPVGSQMQSCVNGWHDMPFLSPRVKDDTRFRMASLSKVVTFIGLLSAPENAEQYAPRRESAMPPQWPVWMNVPVAQILAPDVPTANYKDMRVTAIRVQHLLNHSAGFDRLKEADPMLMRDITPWCPHMPEKLASEPLQFAPGARYSYANVGYCLAPVVYERATQQNFFHHLTHTLRMQTYGMAFIDQQDAKLSYNFMHQEFYGPDFMRYFDAKALRTSMGMTGNAKGLAQFVHDNWTSFMQFHAMRTSAISCNEADQNEECFDGVMRRKVVDGKQVWEQRGYLPGMGAVLLIDKQGNLLIWLGSGEPKDKLKNSSYLTEQFTKNVH